MPAEGGPKKKVGIYVLSGLVTVVANYLPLQCSPRVRPLLLATHPNVYLFPRCALPRPRSMWAPRPPRPLGGGFLRPTG